MEGEGLRSLMGNDDTDDDSENDEDETEDETDEETDGTNEESFSESEYEMENESEDENEDENEDAFDDENEDENEDEVEDEETYEMIGGRKRRSEEETVDSGCTDIDECSLETHNCDAEANCNNTVGSFECKCKDDYIGDGITCSVLDACEAGIVIANLLIFTIFK